MLYNSLVTKEEIGMANVNEIADKLKEVTDCVKRKQSFNFSITNDEVEDDLSDINDDIKKHHSKLQKILAKSITQNEYEIKNILNIFNQYSNSTKIDILNMLKRTISASVQDRINVFLFAQVIGRLVNNKQIDTIATIALKTDVCDSYSAFDHTVDIAMYDVFFTAEEKKLLPKYTFESIINNDTSENNKTSTMILLIDEIKIKNQINTYINNLRKQDVGKEVKVLKNLKTFCSIFQLTPLETEIMTSYYLIRCITKRLEIQGLNLKPFFNNVSRYNDMVLKYLNEAKDRLAFDNLIAKNLIPAENYDFSFYTYIDNILLDDVITPTSVMDKLLSKPLSSELTKTDFEYIESDDIEYVTNIIKNSIKKKQKGINFVLYGDPGTGKTEFAKMIAKELNIDVREASVLKYTDKASENDRLAIIKTIQSLIIDEPQIILVDECDDCFMNAGNKIKINTMLENNVYPMIWITNNIKWIDRAYIRRFNYAIEFPKISNEVLKKIWAKKVDQYKLKINNDDIDSLVNEYTVQPGYIELAVKNAKLTKTGYKGIVRTLTNLHLRFNDVEAHKKPTDNFNYDLLNTDIDLQELSSRIKKLGIKAFSLCLYGVPGTGKSAYAIHLANELGIDYIHKKGSDLIDCYVGNTEKNIAEAFREAKKKNAMLIFDEVDTFLQDRTRAVRSWETTQVNEMLTQMENADIPFIATTNLINNLDQASLRRFTFKVKYDYLKKEQLNIAFKHFFNTDLTTDISYLDNISNGDFATVQKKAQILNITDEQELIKMLESEANIKDDKKSLKIGF